jgi:hypothetical protein
MGVIVEEDFKCWTAKRKAALLTETLQGKTSVFEAARSFDLSPSEIEDWVDEGKKGLEKALRAKPLRRLPFFGNEMRIEASVLLGDRDEEVQVHGEPDCWDFGRGRCRVAGGRDLQEAWRQ